MTDDDAAAAKRELRTRMRALRRDLVADGSAPARSAVVVDALLELESMRTARRVVAYRSLPSEVDTVPLLDWCRHHGIDVVVPDQRSDAPPPVAAGWADVVVVPVLAATRDGRRLGQGGGWYDRFLRDRRPECPAIGLAFRSQLVDELPTEPHDVRLDCVVSEDGASWAT